MGGYRACIVILQCGHPLYHIHIWQSDHIFLGVVEVAHGDVTMSAMPIYGHRTTDDQMMAIFGNPTRNQG